MSTLALLGGPKSVTREPVGLFTRPIITRDDEEALLDVPRRRATAAPGPSPSLRRAP
jgi:hypothetical protein